MAELSWYDAVQFCNYLTTGDTENGVYKFTGDSLTDIMNHEQAGSTYGVAYFLPTEDEWYKAAYYTGSSYSLYTNGTNIVPIAGTDSKISNVQRCCDYCPGNHSADCPSDNMADENLDIRK